MIVLRDMTTSLIGHVTDAQRRRRESPLTLNRNSKRFNLQMRNVYVAIALAGKAKLATRPARRQS